ncbi:secretion protein HlyD [Aliidongia dinghuensis]|uniref:Secretion protein HlyD n=1 Tax=Aliidongia dinghuensis TaxID=1867774 RepID=A0A8J2YP67_9PROT|nr:HlyD family efflux transporter periplasmic adaptor subunit [Aliidongia dinghuensis]GGE98803.1 secretion protein HlyD [Aliidongia dinghuensis]
MRWIIILIVFGAAAATLWWSEQRASEAPAWQGYAEADYVKVGPVFEGQLTRVSVARGDAVAAGEALFQQDPMAELAQRDQAARQLGQAEQQLANLEAASKPTEILQAEANLADARATLTRSKADLERSETLLRGGHSTQQTVDQLRAAYLSAEARVRATDAALEQAQAPMGREAEIKAQRAAVDAARAALAMAEWRLEQRSVAAPVAGRVADVLARPGETMAAGAPVVSLLPPQNIFIRFFVPESAVGGLHRGDAVAFACDGCPPDLVGTISFIAPQAEYTPPVIYSEASRTKLVFLIEARPRPAQAASLNPGQPMEVRPVAPGPQAAGGRK